MAWPARAEWKKPHPPWRPERGSLSIQPKRMRGPRTTSSQSARRRSSNHG